jgi:cyclopropane-fatty-acyl-phospholipid synthase
MSNLQSETIAGIAKRSDRLDRFIRQIDRLEFGTLELHACGRSFTLNGEHPGPAGSLDIHRLNPLLRRLLLKGDLGLAEAYLEGDWSSPDLTGLMTLFARNQHRLNAVSGMSQLARLAMRGYHWYRRNTRKGSARNIMAHYDLGNDFYALWLDRGMTYSSAIFQHQDESLDSAQATKYTRLLDILEAQPGQRILEIGCGWGGLAIAAAERGIQVDAVTLSPAQLAWAERRIEERGLGDFVKLSLQDYRNLSGSYDHIVSIEMFEAVGEAYWSTYMEIVRRLLKPGGRAALQVITIAEQAFDNYRRNPDFIQRYIFPGGMLPTSTHLLEHAQGAGLQCLRDDGFGRDYAETLRRWQDNFNRNWGIIQAMGFDECFQRMWRYYLSYCEAGFLYGHIDLRQVLFARPG